MSADLSLSARISNWLRFCLDAYHAFAGHVNEVVKVIKLAPFSVFAVLGISALLFVDQSLEALRVLAENGFGEKLALFFSFAALLYLSITAWYCARVLIVQL